MRKACAGVLVLLGAASAAKSSDHSGGFLGHPKRMPERVAELTTPPPPPQKTEDEVAAPAASVEGSPEADTPPAEANATQPKKQLTDEQLKDLHRRVLQSLFERLDSNKDGKMSLSEMIDHVQKKHIQSAQHDAKGILLRMDTNRDDKLSFKEISDEWDLLLDTYSQSVLNSSGTNETGFNATELEKTKQLEKKKFDAADKDKDGLLSDGEITAMFFPETDNDTMEVHIADLIEQHDHDSNGKIDLDEVHRALNHTAEGNPQTKVDFKSLDTDDDDHLSLHELKPWTDGTFSWRKLLGNMISSADEDNDEHITIEEWQKADDAGKIDSLSIQSQLREWAMHSEF